MKIKASISIYIKQTSAAMKQKEKEQYFMDRFLKLYGRLEGYTIEAGESPDFIAISPDGNRIGIEITELVNSKKDGESFAPAERHGLEKKITNLAEQKFLEDHSIPLNVSIAFQDRIICDNKKAIDISTQISSAIYRHLEERNLDEYFYFSIDRNIPKECSYIQVMYAPTVTQSIWYPFKAGFLPNVEVKEIQNVLAGKESKYKDYLKRTDRTYLLIIEGAITNSWFDSLEQALSASYTTSYDKVFVLRDLEDRLFELKKK